MQIGGLILNEKPIVEWFQDSLSWLKKFNYKFELLRSNRGKVPVDVNSFRLVDIRAVLGHEATLFVRGNFRDYFLSWIETKGFVIGSKCQWQEVRHTSSRNEIMDWFFVERCARIADEQIIEKPRQSSFVGAGRDVLDFYWISSNQCDRRVLSRSMKHNNGKSGRSGERSAFF